MFRRRVDAAVASRWRIRSWILEKVWVFVARQAPAVTSNLCDNDETPKKSELHGKAVFMQVCSMFAVGVKSRTT
jgi:hypothetical protein